MSGLRETKKRRTRHTLEQVALELFLRNGYDQTSVEEIAAAANVSERTYFRYFASKEDTVFAGLDDDLELFATALAPALVSAKPSWADITDGLVAFADNYESARGINHLRTQIVPRTPVLRARASQVQTQWRHRTADVLATRYRRPATNTDIQILAGITLAVLNAAIAEWLTAERSVLAAKVRHAAARTSTLLGPT